MTIKSNGGNISKLQEHPESLFYYFVV